jgi:hypothetical protein
MGLAFWRVTIWAGTTRFSRNAIPKRVHRGRKDLRDFIDYIDGGGDNGVEEVGLDDRKSKGSKGSSRERVRKICCKT